MTTRKQSPITAARIAWATRMQPESMRPLAHLFWHLVLMCVALLGGSIIAYAGYFFMQTMRAVDPVDSTPVHRTQRLDRAKLDEVLRQFEARRAVFDERTLPAVPSDPSL